MESTKTFITVKTTVNAPINKVWEFWTKPEHLTQWTHASDDWHAPYAENDLRTSGKFKTTMAAKDGSFSFDFEGIYTHVEENRIIAYTLGDGRTVKISFSSEGNNTQIIETFEAENTNPVEMQQTGWQSILNNFKKYTESK
ncbi:SRPBCC family protein [Pedobacter metabolipauper]|uniref:Uncharacterized protein YndB with AHSA1/START domain n=1 Tax=Pedobacter metabolipauper TaxID=425513 RepID=A0A4R6T0B0_9SPHI|nr:SRPBCC family protein [Pedobacter metabolipauper]TDQ11807.1 uncharacterized protein YndB with AHSA1/START domain [Pedobacter metabolipauper]